MEKLRFAVLGTGFWSQFQVGAWSEIPEVELVALYNRTKAKAEVLAKRFQVERIYDDAAELFAKEKLDFVDIITDVDTHFKFVEMAVDAGIKHIICQKPMAPDWETAKRMVEKCRQKSVSLYIHENFRWQVPIRRFKRILDSGVIGKPFKARVSFLSGFPVFDNQPFLKELPHFILTDMGSHVLDICRYLFGEASKLWCQIRTVNPEIKGEDIAVIMMEMVNGMPLYTEMSYASIVEHDMFSTVNVLVEGEKGSIALGPGNSFEIRTTIAQGTTLEQVEFPSYNWADSDYIVNHESGIHINRNILNAMIQKGKAETTGEDNLETVRLVWASYESAKRGELIYLRDFD
ncbi:Gfo/Idh/MocA family protein [Proteiniphilum acetatigenes]|uniref:Gfo/Idh/MocA family protein n=1 Tax=Proteiniphilum acetatigenes TaxID=294710 RepID=UPI00039F5268|nr:Gfo/Idh/MocA family oxidoreductase [Proteiniphilum acetatigenes]SFK88219.1 Predicted dehydrogenase [Porphyromonadaceae bacterium KH3CP3RA]